MEDEEAAKWRDIFSEMKKAESRPEMEVIEERMHELIDKCQGVGFVCRKVSVFEFSVDFAGAEIAKVVYVMTGPPFAVQNLQYNDTIVKRFDNADMALEFILSMKTIFLQLRTQCHNLHFHCETITPTVFQVGTYYSAFVQVTKIDQEHVTVTGLDAEYMNREGFQNSKTFQDVQLAMIYINQIIYHPFMGNLEITLRRLLVQMNGAGFAQYTIERPSIFELLIRRPPGVLCVNVTLVAHDTISVQDRQFPNHFHQFGDVPSAYVYIRQILIPPTGPVGTLQLLHARVQLLEARILG